MTNDEEMRAEKQYASVLNNSMDIMDYFRRYSEFLGSESVRHMSFDEIKYLARRIKQGNPKYN